MADRGGSFDGMGNRALLSLFRSGKLQRKARVSQPDDPLEHEADVAAETGEARGLVASSVPPPNPFDTHQVLSGLEAGEPLHRDVQGLMESRFGEPFDDVRVHTGDRAAEAADSVQARAFTVGSNVVFGAGEFAPESTEGRRLLAHELTHVVQQRSPGGTPAPESTTEAEADRAAHDAESGGPVAVESGAHPGEIQRQPFPSSTVPGSRVKSRMVYVDEKPMASIVAAETMTKTGQHWDEAKKVYSVSVAVGGFFIDRHTHWKKADGADANAGDKTIVISGTDKNASVESITINGKGSGKQQPKQPKQQPPPKPPEPKDEPAQDQKDEKAAETKPSTGGDRVKKVEQKSNNDPKGALQDAEDLSPGELKTMGSGTRKNLLDAAAQAPRGSTGSQVTKDIITTTPDRDAGALSDALQADGGKLLEDLKSKTDPQTAAELDEAAKDLAARRIDATEPDPGKDIVELTPEMKKKADEIRALFKKMGKKRTYDLDEVRVDENWPIVKTGMEQKFQTELRNLDYDVRKWNEEHGDSASDIASGARDEANKAFEKMRSAKTERELYEGWKAATHALWRANQMMDAKRTLGRFESSVQSWNESQSGLAAIAAVPSHVLGGVSRDRPNEIAAETRTQVDAALAQLRDAKTREEKIEAATRLKQILADANFKLTGHKEEVEEGAERLIIGVEVVAATTVIILAPEVAIPGMLIGAGLGAAREGAQKIDDPNHKFSGRAVFDSAVVGTVLAPLAANSAVVAYVVLPGAGIYSASGEIQKGHFVTAGFDVVTSLAPVGIKATTGRGPALPSARSLRASTLVLVLEASSRGVENVPGLGGHSPTASIPRGPEVAWVLEAPGTSSRTPGGIILPGETSVSPDVTPGFEFGVPSPKPPAPTWATVQPGSFTPTYIPFTVNIAPPTQAATPEDAAFDQSFDATFSQTPVGTQGVFQTTQRLVRGNLGERLGTEALASMGHTVLMYKPSILGTNQGGIDMVTRHNGVLHFVDNKALTRSGNVSSVSALTTNFAQNLAQTRAEFAQIATDPARPPAERAIYQQAVNDIDSGNYVRVVTNANVSRDNQVPTGVTSNLTSQGIGFINVR